MNYDKKGIDMTERRLYFLVVFLSAGHVTPTGVATSADFHGITYSSLFQLLETHENPVSLSPWICPLVLVLITQRDDLESLMRFRGTEMDSPLTAATRFCALIGSVLCS